MTVYRIKPSNTQVNFLENPSASPVLQTATTNTFGASSFDKNTKLTGIHGVVHPSGELTYSDVASSINPVKPFALVLNKTVPSGNADDILIDQSAGASEVNMQYLELNDVDNKLVIKGSGDPAKSKTKVGVINAYAGNITVKNGANLQLDSGRIVNTTIKNEDTSIISFGDFADVDGNVFRGVNLNSQSLSIGSGGMIDTTGSTSNKFLISEEQSITLSNLDKNNAAVTSGTTVGTIKTNTLTNKGILTIENGRLEGDLINVAGSSNGVDLQDGEITGKVTNTSGIFKMAGGQVQGNFENNGSAYFSFENTKDATISGSYTGNDESRMHLTTGNYSLKVGGMSLTSEKSVLIVGFSDKGCKVSPSALAAIGRLDTDVNALGNAFDDISKDIGSQTLIDLGNKDGSFDAGSIFITAMSNIKKGTAVKIAKTTGKLTDFKKIGLMKDLEDELRHKMTSFGRIPNIIFDNFQLIRDDQNIILVVLDNISKPWRRSFSSRSLLAKNALNRSFSHANSHMAGSFMASLTTGISGDMNAQTHQFGIASVTTSGGTHTGKESHFLGMNMKISSDSSLGAYVGYSSDMKKMTEFAAFHLSKVGGFNLLSSVAYGANSDQRTQGEIQLDTDTKSLISQTKLSKSFEFSGTTLTPHMTLGVGQIIDAQNSLRDGSETLTLTADSTAGFGGLGMDIVHKFNIDTVAVQTFASLNYTSEFGARSFTIADTTDQISASTASLMLGVKANVDSNSNLYATTQIEQTGNVTDHKFTLGMNVKF
jgi:hypothetical protein